MQSYSSGNIIGVTVVPDLEFVENLIKEKKLIRMEKDKEKEYFVHRKSVLEEELANCKERFVEKNAGFGFVLCKQPMIAEYIIKVFEGGESFGVGIDVWTLQAAPYYSDIIWKNPPSADVFPVFKRVFWNFLFVLLFLIFFTPLELAGALSDALTRVNFPQKISSLITISLPSVAISLFYSVIIPLAIRYLTEQEKNHLYSKTLTSAFSKYMFYSIGIMIFFPLLGAVTLDKLIQKLVHIEVAKLSLNLVTNIAMVGEFFVNFLVSISLGSNFLDLLIINQYFTSNFYVYRKMFEEKTAPVFDFTYEYCRVLIIFCVVLVFSVGIPLILPFGCLFFFGKYWIDKYNLLYVYRVESTAGNSLQGLVVTFLLLAVGISQVINSGLFIASGTGFLIAFGTFLALIGTFAIFGAWGTYQYWDHYYPSQAVEVTIKDLYLHPYLKYV